ncbi:MAG TPA: cell division protein SepF [Nocardioides sp.]
MSGAMRKIGEYLGLVEDPGYDDYDELDDRADERDHPQEKAREERPVRRRTPEPAAQPAPVADLAERRRVQVAPAPVPVPAAVEMSKIVTLHPRTYNEARAVGENYREGVPVIMNLGDMDDADAKRLVDFAAGLIFATRGDIERVTSKVFLLSPPNVTVAAEEKQRIATNGFFNQS